MIPSLKLKVKEPRSSRGWYNSNLKPLKTFNLVLLVTLLTQTLIVQAQSDSNQPDNQSDISSQPTTEDAFPKNNDLAGTYKGDVKIKIDGIEPEAGPTYGETRVLVRGTPLRDLQPYFPKPMCKFGHDDMVVEATWVLCTTRPRVIDEKEARHRDKNDTCLQCDNAPAISKPEIIPFTISLIGDFSDAVNSVPYRYYPPTRVYAIYPRYGPKDGETVVQIWGENFLNFDQNTRCGFGSKSVPATFINSNYMICVSPFSDVVEKPIPFSISLNNQQNSRDMLYFWYYSWPAISELVPDRGPDQGGTKVLLKGRNFFPFKDFDIDNANDTFCMFENLAKVPAKIINSTKVICYSPPSYVLRQSIVEITLNNQQYTDDNNIFYYFRPPFLFDINPREGPVQGNTRVIAIGSNFRDTKNVSCKFNETVVPGKYLSPSEIECYSPPVPHPGFVPLSVSLEYDMFSTPVQYLYYERPEIIEIYPTCGPDYGNTQITIFGKNFLDMGHNKAMCVFNKTYFTNATIMEQDIIKCSSPTLYNDQGFSTMHSDVIWYNLEITLDGGRNIEGPAQNFTYYKDPKLFEIIPDSGPIRGGTVVKIVGKGFNHTGGCNKTVRFAALCEIPPLNDTLDNVTFAVTPPVSVPDQVVVHVSLNGQQYTRDVVLHQRDLQNTFEFYDEPVVTSYTPKAGPSIGNTKVKLNGFGFTPRRDIDGNYDKKRNKMWIRFVDPDTLEELSPMTEVDDGTLFDDEAVWTTPAQPSETKALMQVSLNKQDWTSVYAPNKTYSFYYYESPHIEKLLPSFGPVKTKGDKYMDIKGRNFFCPDTNCSELRVRFGDPEKSPIYEKGQWLNDSYVRCKIPKYSKPDVLQVELTMNGQDFTNDQKTYGYFDPYVLDAVPRLISVDGTTKVKLKGFGFVNSSETKSLFNTTDRPLLCQGQNGQSSGNCVKEATYIDKNTLETDTFPQAIVNYKDGSGDNIMWDPMTLEGAVYEADFTENNVEVFYYQDPDFKNLSRDESPANQENDIIIDTDFKENPQDRLDKYGNFTCRFKADDGTVKYTKGEMIKYPLEKGYLGKKNAVKCKNPKWDLKDKPQEKVKLDVAVNGQDFKGNFDFYFTYELKIYRTVPMSGPVLGKTNTRIIGTGFRPRTHNVDLKWGVLKTVVITKEEVTDYVYQQHAFENMYEGNEEIKAYVYEAEMYKRVDLAMQEDFTYHSIYLPSPRMWYDNKTQGGPYYVEVGNDIKINYLTQEMVNASIGFNNQTNKTEYRQDLQNVTKSFVYYDYEPSSVEFYYYKDCVIKQMQPHSGLLSGGTEVQVVGAWFKYMPQYGVVPHCKFGDKVVRGYFDSTVRIVCRAPPGVDLGVVYPFDVSLNGADWTESGLTFSYYEQPNLYNITPDAGPEAGGTPIYIYGSNFTNKSNANEFNCRFTPISLPIPPKKMPGIYLNDTTIMCSSPGGWGRGDAMKLQVTFNGGDYDNNNFTFTFFSVSRAFPRSGPSDGLGGDIIIEGIGFRNDTNPVCKLNNTEYQPTQVTWDKIYCPMPKAEGGDGYFGNVALSVSPNGRDWTNFPGGFQYYPQPLVEDIFPKQGPAVGVGIINFYGDGFRDDYSLEDLACKIGDSVGKAVFVTTKHIKCVVEDMELVNEGEYLPAQVALNSYSWSQPTNDTFFLPYGVESIYPSAGPTSGVTDVIVQGKGFTDEEGVSVRCRFGTPANYAIVEGQILSYERIACRAPSDFQPIAPATFPIDVPFSLALSNDEYDPWTETSHKFRFYNQPNLVRAEPPEVEVGTISEVLVFADDQGGEFFDPMPVAKLVNAIDEDAEFGQTYSGITCQFGRFGETQAVFINETVVKCVTPAVDDDPDSIYREEVKLTIAMNGLDHDEESSQVLFTFVGTGTYLVFWPFLIGALLIGLLIVALVVCCATLFNSISLNDYLQSKRNVGGEGRPHVVGIGGGITVPRGRADWNKPQSSIDIVERAAGQPV